MKGICDLADPIMDVSARYDQDGWCVFGSEASWARDCAVARRTRNVNNFALAYPLLSDPEQFYINAFYLSAVRRSDFGCP
eukprot:g9439.t1